MSIIQIFVFFGGLGLFLFGMKVMSDGLELAAGDNLRIALEKATSNRFLGIGIGTGVTAIIQSSSATTVMLVGFVNAGLMTLAQATSVIMGANIGTTVTAQILATNNAFKFSITDIAPVVLFAGIVLYMFINSRITRKIGYIILGFGILFWGMGVMGDAISPLKEDPAFIGLLTSFVDNPLLAILVGTFFTAIIQSSSATTGILVVLAGQGIMPLEAAAYIILGSNIGTCITAVLASIWASRDSKRTALVHVLFNVIGVIIFGSLIAIFPGIVTWISNLSPGDAERQIANFHTIFNVATTAILMSFINLLVAVVKKIIPERKSEKKVERRLVYLDKNIALTPAIALKQAHREVCRMGHIAVENYENSINALFDKDIKAADEVLKVETTINYLNHEITGALVHLRGLDLPTKDLEQMGMMFSVVSDLERIGDLAENIAEYAHLLNSEKIEFSKEATASLKALADASLQTVKLSMQTYENGEMENITTISELEERTDELRDVAIEGHLERLMTQVCAPRAGVIFTDFVSDLERSADHATSIAFSLLGEPSLWDDKITTRPLFKNEII